MKMFDYVDPVILTLGIILVSLLLMVVRTWLLVQIAEEMRTQTNELREMKLWLRGSSQGAAQPANAKTYIKAEHEPCIKSVELAAMTPPPAGLYVFPDRPLAPTNPAIFGGYNASATGLRSGRDIPRRPIDCVRCYDNGCVHCKGD